MPVEYLKRQLGNARDWVKKNPVSAASGGLDLLGLAYEAANPRETDPAQKFLNTLLVGGGDIGFSLKSGGLDLPVQLIQLSTILNNAADNDPHSALGRLQRSAEFYEPSHYLRLASQAIGQKTLNPQGPDVEAAKSYIEDGMRAQAEAFEAMPDKAKPPYLGLPMPGGVFFGPRF